MDIRRLSTGLVALLLTGSPAMAQTLEKGAADPPFLLIDARRVALGRTGVSRTADLSVVGLNPASAAEARGVVASRFDSPTDLQGLEAAGGFGSVGLGFRHFSVDDLFESDPTGELAGLEVTWLAASVFGAHRITDRLTVGASATLFQEDLLGELATDWGIAVGAQMGGEAWSAGASLRNLGADLVSETEEGEAELPARYRLGGSYAVRFAEGDVVPRAELDLDGSVREPGEIDAHAGVQVALFEHLALRGGFADREASIGLPERDQRWSAGAGVFGDRWEVAYAQEFGGEIGDSESYITLYYRF